jgi:hypothetical protein
MEPQPNEGTAPMTGHPLIRQFLISFVQIALPIGEAVLVQWLTSKGFKLPPIGVPNANDNRPGGVGNSPAGNAGAGSASVVPQPTTPNPERG